MLAISDIKRCAKDTNQLAARIKEGHHPIIEHYGTYVVLIAIRLTGK